jgi:Fe-S-cluster-containing dehydrogenase component
MTPKSVSRRTFLKSALVGGALTAVGGGTALAKGLVSPKPIEKQAEYALIIDTTKCVGCGACETACNLRNHLPAGQSYIHILSRGEGESERFLPVQCQHCADPPCAHVCPTNATYIREDGVVLINEKLCVGCHYCQMACPYQARTFDEERGVADKCWLCLDYVLGGGEPACVHACVLGARLFGRTDDPGSEVAQVIASGQAKPLHPEFGTEPAVLRYIIE